MTAQESASQFAGLPKWVGLTLSVIGILLAFTFFAIAAAFQSRGLTDDAVGAVAAALIGGIFLVSGVVGTASSIRNGETETKTSIASPIRNVVIRMVTMLLGVVAVLAGIDSFWMSFIVLNQEYLHYFEFSHAIHSGSGSQAQLLAEFSFMGSALTDIGLFLLWYAVHPRSLKVFIQKCTRGRQQPEVSSPNNKQSHCNPEDSS